MARRTPIQRRGRRQHRAAYTVMLLPYLVGISALIFLPLIAGAPLAFTNFNAIQPPRFVGLDNFRSMGDDPLFWIALKNTALFVALAVPIRVGGALLVALLLSAKMRGGGLYRASIFVPAIVPDVAWAVTWLWVLNPIYGPLNQALALVGIPGPAWMVTERSAQLGIVLMLTWQLGEGFIVCLAALRDVPGELLDQATVDGASTFRRFGSVTLPMIAPVLLILLFHDTVISLQTNFVPALIVGRGGAPNFATLFMPLHIYREAFDYLRYGYAAAMTWTLFAVTGVVLLAQYLVIKRWRLGFREAEHE